MILRRRLLEPIAHPWRIGPPRSSAPVLQLSQAQEVRPIETASSRRVGIEPSLRRDIADELRDLPVDVAPLVEALRLVKSPGEVAMIRRAAQYADRGVEELLAAAYHSATVAEGFARTGALSRAIIRQVADWEILTTRVLLATWAASRSAQHRAY
jgi:Xaa-Pro aminopeptidase